MKANLDVDGGNSVSESELFSLLSEASKVAGVKSYSDGIVHTVVLEKDLTNSLYVNDINFDRSVCIKDVGSREVGELAELLKDAHRKVAGVQGSWA